MKKLLMVFAFTSFFALNAQETANRFFYELTFKPKKDSVKVDKVMTVLDISKAKSIYQDYTGIAQDSIIVNAVNKMQKSGVFVDIMNFMDCLYFDNDDIKIDMQIIKVQKAIKDDNVAK